MIICFIDDLFDLTAGQFWVRMRDGLRVANLIFLNFENCQFQLRILSTSRIDFQN